MRGRLKFWLLAIFLGALALFCLYQLYYALAYGEIRSGPRGSGRWVTFASDPFWFVFGVSIYSVFALLIGTLLYVGISAELRGESALRKYMSKPPLENARREPERRKP